MSVSRIRAPEDILVGDLDRPLSEVFESHWGHSNVQTFMVSTGTNGNFLIISIWATAK